MTTMDSVPYRGRAVAAGDLPPLATTILGPALPVPLPVDSPVPATVTGLNATQRRAVGAALDLDPAAGLPLLVQGPPGTGKTTMIAELLRGITAGAVWRDEP
ncbi:MAG: hypothetical protein M3462_02035, partial [Chloroflexota bacterium]|nr:hypothetical protein [Chloroflexota bacterium]